MTMIDSNLITEARQTDLADFLLSKGYKLIRNGTRYRHPEHNSLVFTRNSYYWNSKAEHGNSVDYLTKYLGYDFPTAVAELTKNKSISEVRPPKYFNFNNVLLNNNFPRAYAYLNKTRYIDYEIITHLKDNNYLFMDKRNNIVFPIYDETNNIVGAELQGTLTDIRFKGISEGSKYGYGFNIRTSEHPEKAFFFESAIDLISFYELATYFGYTDIKNSLLVSLSGLKVIIIENILKAFKINFKPIVAVDNDNAGDKFKKALEIENIAFKEEKTPYPYKDWNDFLKSKK